MKLKGAFSMSNKELLFLLEKGVTYKNIEDVFTNENHYRAMKRLSDTEKFVLFQTVIEEQNCRTSCQYDEYYKRYSR